MATLKAPFNFVPLSDKVYFPAWADQISHDVPFSDGLSGELELTITAEIPILVGAGPKEEQDGWKHVRFVHTPDGRYYIPGSTLKGAIRNVLEILSYGKMTRCCDTRFPIRDVNNDDYCRKLASPYVWCGWMRLNNGQYYIYDYTFPKRLSITEIDRNLSTRIGRNGLSSDYERTAQWKYDQIGNKSLDVDYVDAPKIATSPHDKRKFVRLVPKGNGTAGTIVLTGQPNRQKRYEFVFPKVTKPGILVGNDVIKDFIDIHKDSTDYSKFRRIQLMNGQSIPVFFLFDEEEKRVEAIGLTLMFKIPSYNSVYDGIRGATNALLSAQKDMAECMFGYANDNSPLKGRVHFGHAMLCGQPKMANVDNPVLSQPHASYYPLYLASGLDWDSESKQFVIAGRKRYPVRESNKVLRNPAPDDADDRKTTSKLHPLGSNSVFKAKIRYHNLRPVELGALIAAITFNGHDECRYNIGLAKPLGYGKVKIEITNLNETVSDCVNAFRQEMKSKDAGWESSKTMKELIAMAKGIPVGKDGYFTYMKMDMNRNSNEFYQGKVAKPRQALKRFTEII